MGAITTAVIAIGAVVLGWITIEIACKPCLEKGRDAMDRSLNPDYDPDDEVSDIRAPLNPNADLTPDLDDAKASHPSSTTSEVLKADPLFRWNFALWTLLYCPPISLQG